MGTALNGNSLGREQSRRKTPGLFSLLLVQKLSSFVQFIRSEPKTCSCSVAQEAGGSEEVASRPLTAMVTGGDALPTFSGPPKMRARSCVTPVSPKV